MEFREDEPLRIAMDKSCSFSSGIAAFGVAAFFDFFRFFFFGGAFSSNSSAAELERDRIQCKEQQDCRGIMI